MLARLENATPGSITCPLVPGVPAKRSVLQSLGYIAYVASLVTALRSPTIGIEQVGPPVALLALLTPFDLVTFNASRGEHYGYMLVCCLFPWKDALVGEQRLLRMLDSVALKAADVGADGPSELTIRITCDLVDGKHARAQEAPPPQGDVRKDRVCPGVHVAVADEHGLVPL